jgi:hypothetical protein
VLLPDSFEPLRVFAPSYLFYSNTSPVSRLLITTLNMDEISVDVKAHVSRSMLFFYHCDLIGVFLRPSYSHFVF